MFSSTAMPLNTRAAAWVRRQMTLNNALQLIGAIGGLWGNYLINHSHAAGFLLWMVSNGALVLLQYRVKLWALVILHFSYLYLCFEGISSWYARAPDSMPWMPMWLLRIVQLVA